MLGLGAEATIELNLQLRNSALCELRASARQRLLEATKHEIRKYIKRERRRALPGDHVNVVVRGKQHGTVAFAQLARDRFAVATDGRRVLALPLATDVGRGAGG